MFHGVSGHNVTEGSLHHHYPSSRRSYPKFHTVSIHHATEGTHSDENYSCVELDLLSADAFHAILIITASSRSQLKRLGQ